MRHRRGIYARATRWWGDFRAYGDVGGRQEPLCPPGVRLATTDFRQAVLLYARRVEYYEMLRHNKVATGIAEVATLAAFADHHLQALLTEGKIRPSTVERYADALANVIERLGADNQLTEIAPQRLTQYVGRRRHEGAAAQTIRHELVALSRLFKRALSEGRALTNPVALLYDKPRVERGEATWLTLDEAGALLEAAFEYDTRQRRSSAHSGHGVPLTSFGPIIATFLLTGGRKQEVLGLRRVDIAWADELVRFVPYEGRTLKRGDGRSVQLWPQLADILRQYLRSTEAHVSGLLFPSPVPHKREPRWRIGNLRKPLEWALKRAGIDKPVTLHTLRHTYTAARLQTYHVGPRGETVQVGAYQVARELGHRSSAMVEQIYGHVAPRPERLQPEVGYPISRAERVKAEASVTTGVTATPLPAKRAVAKL